MGVQDNSETEARFDHFFQFFAQKRLQHFFRFDDTFNIKYVLNAEDLYLVPQKKSEWPNVYFCHNRCLKLSYFHDFDGRECTISRISGFSFGHISLKNYHTNPFLGSKWPEWRDLSNELLRSIVQQIFEKLCNKYEKKCKKNARWPFFMHTRPDINFILLFLPLAAFKTCFFINLSHCEKIIVTRFFRKWI